jgi:plasmid stabilization system protein ParE
MNGVALHRQLVIEGDCAMPQQAWSDKRERQYEHIKEQTEQRGSSEKRAKEIAARTVNKDRAQSGESRQASKTSTHDASPEHRGGKRSGNRQGPGGQTKQQLYEDAKRKNVPGRSTMTKQQLKNALYS